MTLYEIKRLFRFPFDHKNPFGFSLAAIITYLLAVFAINFLANIVSIAIGTNLLLISITKDIKSILKKIHHDGDTPMNHLEIINQIVQYVQLHTDVKELSCFTCAFALSVLSKMNEIINLFFDFPSDWSNILRALLSPFLWSHFYAVWLQFVAPW